jgi:NTE family protein
MQWVVDGQPRRDTLVFQVDLWDARGDVPRTMAQVLTRHKEIVYSSRTRANSDRVRQLQQMRNTLAILLDKLPAELRTGPEFEILNSASIRKVYNLVHLIYRAQEYENDSKDYEFSRVSMQLAGRIQRHRPHAAPSRSAGAPAESRGIPHVRSFPRRSRMTRRNAKPRITSAASTDRQLL